MPVQLLFSSPEHDTWTMETAEEEALLRSQIHVLLDMSLFADFGAGVRTLFGKGAYSWHLHKHRRFANYKNCVIFTDAPQISPKTMWARLSAPELEFFAGLPWTQGER